MGYWIVGVMIIHFSITPSLQLTQTVQNDDGLEITARDIK